MGKTKQKQDRSHYLFSNRELANLIGPLVIEQLLAVPDWKDRKSTRLNSSHMSESRMPSSA